MNSKAIKKQLLAAVAMVLVAAVALGSSTYAWFVASGTVTAQGMSVHATSEGGLVISYDTQNWGIVATADANNVALNPTSTLDMSHWYHATAMNSADYKADETTREDVSSKVMNGTAFRSGEENTYVVAKTFNIRSTGNSDAGNLAQGLYVSNITVTGANNQQMTTALRVGIICDFQGKAESGPFIYGPVKIGNGEEQNAAKPSYPVYSAYNADTQTNGEKLGDVTLLSYGPEVKDKPLLKNNVVIPNSTNTGNYVKVTVVIWFEGEDWNLVSDKYNTAELNVTVDFSSLGSAGTIA